MSAQNAATLLQELRSLGAEVTVSGDRIRLKARVGALTEEIRERVRDLKPEIFHLLSHEPGLLECNGVSRTEAVSPPAVSKDAADSAAERPSGIASHPVLSMRLSEYEAAGCPIELAVNGLSRTIWFVPGETHASALVREGVRRGRIWTAAELRVVAALPEAGQRELLTLATLKTQFDGEVLNVLEPEPDLTVPGNPEPRPSCHACSGRRFWRSTNDVVTCSLCHPPAAPHLIAAWIDNGVEREADHD